jgi:LysM repeat protein
MGRAKITIIVLLFVFMLAISGLQSVAAKPDVPPGFPCKEYYYVRSGDTLTSISQKFNTPPLVLVKMNNLNRPELLFPGQELCVKYYVTAGTFYGVQPGDTLEQIADDFDQQPEFVSSVNNLEDGVVFQGQVLFIPRNQKFFQ